MSNFKFEKYILFLFALASFAVSFHQKREVFPIFDWALFAQAPKSFPYHVVLVSSTECNYKRVPLTIIEKGLLTNLQNSLLRDPSSFKNELVRKHFFQQLKASCDQLETLKVELTKIRTDPLIYYRYGNDFEITDIINSFEISNASL